MNTGSLLQTHRDTHSEIEIRRHRIQTTPAAAAETAGAVANHCPWHLIYAVFVSGDSIKISPISGESDQISLAPIARLGA